MQALYVASNPPNKPPLMVEHEITKLQKQLRALTQGGIQFEFLPALAFQELRQHVERIKPDVLHISAHGTPERVELVDSHGRAVALTLQSLPAALGVRRPRLLYLSACHSAALAEQLKTEIPIVIGTTDSIENYFAREASAAFYEALFTGYSVKEAFDASSGLLKALSDNKVTTELFCSPSDGRKVLFSPPRLVARFEGMKQGDGNFLFEPGFLGASEHTTQTIFFTDDETFIRKRKGLERSLCWVNRDKAYGDGIRWLDRCWQCDGDFNLFATAVTQNGEHRTVHAKASDALSAYYRAEEAKGKKVPKRILNAIAEMRGPS